VSAIDQAVMCGLTDSRHRRTTFASSFTIIVRTIRGRFAKGYEAFFFVASGCAFAASPIC
jgi:hypothetical protein